MAMNRVINMEMNLDADHPMNNAGEEFEGALYMNFWDENVENVFSIRAHIEQHALDFSFCRIAPNRWAVNVHYTTNDGATTHGCGHLSFNNGRLSSVGGAIERYDCDWHDGSATSLAINWGGVTQNHGNTFIGQNAQFEFIGDVGLSG